MKRKEDIMNALKAKTEKYIIPGTDIEIELRSLLFDELTEYSTKIDSGDIKGALNFILFSALRNNFAYKKDDAENGWDDSEISELIRNMQVNVASQILNKIQVLSGLIEPKKLMENQEA